MCIRDSVQPVQYVIEVENGNEEYQLFYAGDGNLLQKRDRKI